MNFAFNEDHTSLLSSKAVLSQYKTILNTVEKSQRAAGLRSGGYLKVRFDYTYDIDSPRPLNTLILRPSGKENAETVTHLSERDSGKILGPFPPGAYTASIVTGGGRPTEKVVPVSIESNQTGEVNFVLVPDGEIRGGVTASLNPEDKHVGMPDYIYRSVDKNIHLQSVALKGEGIHRKIQAIEGEEVNNNDYLI